MRSRAPANRSTKRCSGASRLGSPTSRATSATPTPITRVARGDRVRPAAGVLSGDPAVPVRDGDQGPLRGRADQARARRRREAVRPRPRLGPRARGRHPPVHRRVPALSDRPLPREDGPGGVPLPALRQHDARAGLEPRAHLQRADHDGRELRRRGSRALLRSGRRAAGRGRQPPDAGGGDGRDGGPGRRRRRHAQGREVRRLPLDGRRRPGALRARAIRRLPRHRRRRCRVDHGDLCGAAAGDRQLALGGRAVLHPHRQAAAGDPDRAAARVPPPAAPGLHVASAGGRRSRVSWWSSSTRRPASGWRSTLIGPTRADRRRSRSTWSSRQEGGEGPTPVRGSAARRDGRRQHAVHPPGQRRGGLADHGAAARCPATGASLRARFLGPARRPIVCSPASAAGTPRGWRHERRAPEPSASRAARRPQRPPRPRPRPPSARAERRRAVAVPADRRLRVPVGLPHRRAGRPRRLDRLAVRAALRRAQRVRLAARPRGRPVPVRAVRHDGPLGPPLRAGHQRAGHDVEDRRAAGSRSATR